MISQQDIERIASANDIVEVINGYFPLKRAGAVWKAVCPFHREKTPSFSVNPARQTFKCFGCGAGGSVFKFVELYENVSFPEAAKRLAARRGIHLQDEPISAEENAKQRRTKRLLALHAEVAEWYHTQLLRTKGAEHARAYLKKRGFTAEIAKSWKLGYAPNSWDAVSNFAIKHGYTERELKESGLVSVKEESGRFYDRFRDRLMIPICDDIGQVIAFSGRVLGSDEGAAKYVNSPESPLFTKGKVLFGLQKSKRAIIDKRAAIVCEGQIDLITAFEAGIKNVTASQGTAFTERQAEKLRQLTGTGEIILCFDSDAAGLAAAEKSLPALLRNGLAVRVATIPNGHDPDSYIRTEGAEAFASRLANAQDFFDYFIDRFATSPEFRTPRGRSDFAKKMAAYVVLVKDLVLRETIINNVSSRLEIPATQLAGLLKPEKPSAWAPKEEEETVERVEIPPMSNAVRLLCQVTLSSEAARRWVMAQEWEKFLGDFVDTELLIKMIGGYQQRFNPEDQTSIAAFMTTLRSEEQAALAEILDLPQAQGDPLVIVSECWRDLTRHKLVQRRDACTAKLRNPQLSLDEVIILQKQVLDLTQQLTHITRPLPPSP